ncbi:MAG: penicillin-binding protein 2, partial [Clostridia bacterium]|nr:penicillin-binding protein 2 [Clostridia bacterium]
MRWPLYRLALAFIIALVTVMGYLGFFAVMRAPQLQASALNPRLALWQKAADRGGIEDRNGEILAESVNGRRLYPWGRAAAPVTGYLAERYGYAGVEAAANDWLAGLTGREGLR